MNRVALAMIMLALSALGARAAEPCTLIQGARVILPGAAVAEVDVAIVGEAIGAVGADLAAGLPPGGARVDARGQMLSAGFIDVFTRLGLVEIDLEPSTVDIDLKNVHQDDDKVVRAAVRASLAFNPRATAIPVTRLGGVTTAMAVPTGGIISGGAFMVELGGGTRAAIVREPAALVATIGGSDSKAASMHVIDVALGEARLWEKDRGAWLANRRAPFSNAVLDLEALGPVVRGEVPLVVGANRASDIEGLLALTEGRGIRLVLAGAAEGWLVRDALAARGVAVIVDPFVYGPGGFDALSARPDNAALMAAAGVKVLVSTFHTHNVRRLRQVVGNAVRDGLPWEAGILAVTERPAEVFGLTDHGRIAAGARANLVLWSGDPLELATRVTRMWIGGREVSLRSRQTELFERWRTLDDDQRP